jgi:hypothetical protein
MTRKEAEGILGKYKRAEESLAEVCKSGSCWNCPLRVEGESVVPYSDSRGAGYAECRRVVFKPYEVVDRFRKALDKWGPFNVKKRG